MKNKTIALIALFPFMSVSAADVYTPVLEEIARNCREIKICEREYDATVAENATGLAPADPEVEFGYLWGNALTGNRKDISVSQEFDFPSVYGNRRALSRFKDAAAADLLKSRRLEVLLDAKKLLVEMVYWNALRRQAEEQVGFARTVLDAQKKMLDLRQTTVIDFNKAALNLTDFENEVSRIDMERNRILSRLMSLNGSNPVSFDVAEYAPESLPESFEDWFAQVEKSHPALQYLRSQIEVEQRNVKLARSENLPKFSVGYQGEYVMESNFSGIKLGITIPLWENRNKVRHARTQVAVADARLADARFDYWLSLRSLYEQVKSLSEIEMRYSSALHERSNDALLAKALELGKINMIEYVTEVQYVFSMREKLLAAKRDTSLACAELYAFQL